MVGSSENSITILSRMLNLLFLYSKQEFSEGELVDVEDEPEEDDSFDDFDGDMNDDFDDDMDLE